MLGRRQDAEQCFTRRLGERSNFRLASLYFSCNERALVAVYP